MTKFALGGKIRSYHVKLKYSLVAIYGKNLKRKIKYNGIYVISVNLVLNFIQSIIHIYYYYYA